MRQYEKVYEDVFNSDYVKNFYYNQINNGLIGNDLGLSLNEYSLLVRKNIEKFQSTLFDNLVKTYWLRRRFCYQGKPMLDDNRHNGIPFCRSLSLFYRLGLSYDFKLISSNPLFSKVASYFKDFFPNFDVEDPFKKKFHYPYKYVHFEHLVAVYQLPERIELLTYSEKRKMSYFDFLDYVVNYINCRNDEIGYHKYDFVIRRYYPPYVRILKDEIAKSKEFNI